MLIKIATYQPNKLDSRIIAVNLIEDIVRPAFNNLLNPGDKRAKNK